MKRMMLALLAPVLAFVVGWGSNQSAGPTTLGAIPDVTLTSLGGNDLMVRNGLNKWVNCSLSGGGTLSLSGNVATLTLGATQSVSSTTDLSDLVPRIQFTDTSDASGGGTGTAGKRVFSWHANNGLELAAIGITSTGSRGFIGSLFAGDTIYADGAIIPVSGTTFDFRPVPINGTASWRFITRNSGKILFQGRDETWLTIGSRDGANGCGITNPGDTYEAGSVPIYDTQGLSLHNDDATSNVTLTAVNGTTLNVTGTLTVNGVAVTAGPPAAADAPFSAEGLFVYAYNDDAWAFEATAITLTDGSTSKTFRGTLTGSNDKSTTGANGTDVGGINTASRWFRAWIIGKSDGTLATLTTAATGSITLPAGYTYYGRAAWFRNKSSGQFRHASKIARRTMCSIDDGAGVILDAGTAVGMTQINATAALPPIPVNAMLHCELDNAAGGAEEVYLQLGTPNLAFSLNTRVDLIATKGATSIHMDADVTIPVYSDSKFNYAVSGVGAATIMVQGWEE